MAVTKFRLSKPIIKTRHLRGIIKIRLSDTYIPDEPFLFVIIQNENLGTSPKICYSLSFVYLIYLYGERENGQRQRY